MTGPRKKDDSSAGSATGGLTGILKGVATLLETLEEMAHTGQELQRTGELRGEGEAKGIRGVYGFSVKVGLGDQGIQVAPFGNIRTDKETGKAEVQEVREPLADIFEEKDYVLVVAEMPGIDAGDVQLEVKDDVLIISAAKGDRKYRKEVLLPASFSRDRIQVTCNNGVLEIKCLK